MVCTCGRCVRRAEYEPSGLARDEQHLAGDRRPGPRRRQLLQPPHHEPGTRECTDDVADAGPVAVVAAPPEELVDAAEHRVLVVEQQVAPRPERSLEAACPPAQVADAAKGPV